MCDMLMSAGVVGAADLLAVWNSIWPYLAMIGGFSLIVFVHELGHFAMAKWCDVRVERFAVGFGKELFGFSKGETRYSFNVLPLGGYVKMLGQEDFDDKTNELKYSDDPRSFVNKSVPARMAIVSAGVIMNIIFAALLFAVCFRIGLESVSNKVAFVLPDSPADRAGIIPGDEVVGINGNRIREFNEMSTAIVLSDPHEPIEFKVKRKVDGQEKIESILVKPEKNIQKGVFEVGIAPGRNRTIGYLGPEVADKGPDYPQFGDKLAEVDGVTVTKDNINQMIMQLAYTRGDVYVDRPLDKDKPDGELKRVKVEVPPQLKLLPTTSGDMDTVSLLGLAPLVRIDRVDERTRAELAGLKRGDTFLRFGDAEYPTTGEVARAIRSQPETDVYAVVLRTDGSKKSLFVRPEASAKRGGTIQASFKGIRDAGSDQPRARVDWLVKGGVADAAGMRMNEVITRIETVSDPTAAQIRDVINSKVGGRVRMWLKDQDAGDGEGRKVVLKVKAAGYLGARYGLVANNLLRVGHIAETLQGSPSPAAKAGIPIGALIKAAGGEKVGSWLALIDVLRQHAGGMVRIDYQDADGNPHSADMPVPNSIRTVLGVGPAAQIVSIDGKKLVEIEGIGQPVSVRYHLGTRSVLTSLIGAKNVPVQYREDLTSGKLKTAYIDVTEDMTDPWLGRVVLTPSIDVGAARVLLKGDTVLEAVAIGFHKTKYFILQVYQMLNRMIFSRTVGVENMSGPLGIVAVGSQVAQTDLPKFLFFMAMISANLAVINFLPLPIVDGGLMVFLIIEKIKGSPVSLKVQIATQMIGLVLIIGTFIFVTVNDALRLWG